MKEFDMKHLSWGALIVFEALLLVSCSTRSATTELPENPPLPTEEIQESEPAPTDAPIPLGTFIGCLYFEGEAVPGYLSFSTDLGPSHDIGNNGRVEVPGECATVSLPPGSYYVSGRYLGDPRCGDETGGGCMADTQPIDIVAGETLKLDLDLVPTGN